MSNVNRNFLKVFLQYLFFSKLRVVSHFGTFTDLNEEFSVRISIDV